MVLHFSSRLLLLMPPTHGLLKHSSRFASPLTPFKHFALHVRQT